MHFFFLIYFNNHSLHINQENKVNLVDPYYATISRCMVQRMSNKMIISVHYALSVKVTTVCSNLLPSPSSCKNPSIKKTDVAGSCGQQSATLYSTLLQRTNSYAGSRGSPHACTTGWYAAITMTTSIPTSTIES